MTRRIDSLADIASRYDAIVFDQWGVLHDGSTPYPAAVQTVRRLSEAGHKLAVLSNSGKRAKPNADRIASFGFEDLFGHVMTSGEALWRSFEAGAFQETRLCAVERNSGDAAVWADGLPLEFTGVKNAEAVLLMGLPDDADKDAFDGILEKALARGLPLYCSNPDLKSPRAGGQQVISPGALAHTYQAKGGIVTFFGKPHRPVFDALETALGSDRLLMVGDSIQHDIVGGTEAGWDTLLIQGGLYRKEFDATDADRVLSGLCKTYNAAPPTFRMETLS